MKKKISLKTKVVKKSVKKVQPVKKVSTKKTDTVSSKDRFTTIKDIDWDKLPKINSEFLMVIPHTYEDIVKKLGKPNNMTEPSVENGKTYYDKIVFEWVIKDKKTDSYITISDAYKYAQSLESKNISFDQYKKKKMEWQIRGEGVNPLSIYAMISLKKFIEGKSYKEDEKELIEIFKTLRQDMGQKQQEAMRNVEKHSTKSVFLTPILAGIALIGGVIIGKSIGK